MEKISTAKLAKAQNAAIAARPYANKLKEIIGEVASASTGFDHPPLEAPRTAEEDRRHCTYCRPRTVRCVQFQSDPARPKLLVADLKAQGRELDFIVQGKKGVGAFKYLNFPDF